MDSVPIIIKHQGKKHEVEVDPSSTGEVFKFQLFSLTNVEPDRQKVLIKGGQLKDDTVMGSLGLKPGQVIMMMGTPGGDGAAALARPKEPIKFAEDMTAEEAAQQEGATPAGLVNLGNTCYMNSTLQTLRSIPELQAALNEHQANPGPGGLLSASADSLVTQLGRLFRDMAKTQDGVLPAFFWNSLKTVFPQFGERSRTGQGYAQQDAEEAFSQIVSTVNQRVKVRDGDDGAEEAFMDKYMGGRITATLRCDEQEARDGGEQPVTVTESFLKLSCHIDKDTSHLRDGLLAGLSEQLEKRSEVLGRDAVYTKKSQISHLPKYLTVHFVRFFWKPSIQKKAKIMKKVPFPFELDAVEFCTDELKKMLAPVRDKVREIRKEEEDVERQKKRRKKRHDDAEPGSSSSAAAAAASSSSSAQKDNKEPKPAGDGDAEMTDYKTDAQWDAEKEQAIVEAKKELYQLIHPDLKSKKGANQSGLYELRAVITHQGASADSGHYMAYVKKQARVDAATGERKGEEDGKWWWFNDEKVSEVPADKIETLSGGGESASALVLLYKAIPLPSADGVAE